MSVSKSNTPVFADNYDPFLQQQEPEPTLSMNPKRFALWLFIVSIVMIFASMTSAYLVRRAEPNWTQFELPGILWASTAIIILSSFTMQMAYLSARRNAMGAVKTLTLITLVLGIAFLILQYESWIRLQQINIYLNGNPSGSFLYVLTGLHGFHLITGLVYIAIVTGMAFRNKIDGQNPLDLELSTIYWHFLDLIWVLLFGFLLWSHSQVV